MTCTCHRCARTMSAESDFIEFQEALIISFRAGYGSTFGDGNLVESVLCQSCMKEVLGAWLRITDDDPFAPKHRLRHPPQGAYQPHQLEKSAAGSAPRTEDLRRLFENQQDGPLA